MQVYDEPTVLLAKRVTGEEEVPEGCVAVVTPDAPDVLSHVSVRARNMRVLFAICHESGPLQEIENLAGKVGIDRVGPPLMQNWHFGTCCHPLYLCMRKVQNSNNNTYCPFTALCPVIACKLLSITTCS